jgi:sulfite exporter TauE/SafE
MIDWWAAISIGLLSSFHCFGMCGPIAFALPLNRTNEFTKVSGSLTYQMGRLVTYMVLGGLFGLLGRGLITAGLQQGVSIGLGILILLAVFIPKIFQRWLPVESWIFKNIGAIKSSMAKLFKKSSYSSLFSIGILNGLLPCGMVYLALAGAVKAGTWNDGALFMLLFGVGTLPMMIAAGFATDWLSLKWRNKLQKATPYIIAALGVLFILRGMDLGIHYLSPEIDQVELTATECK